MLIYDGYRGHLGFKVFLTLKEGDVVAYCLSAHTSGTTQLLDIGIFSPFKSILNELIYSVTSSDKSMAYDQFDCAGFLTEAMHRSFTKENIGSPFRKSGIWPLNPLALLQRPLPASVTKRQGLFP